MSTAEENEVVIAKCLMLGVEFRFIDGLHYPHAAIYKPTLRSEYSPQKWVASGRTQAEAARAMLFRIENLPPEERDYA